MKIPGKLLRRSFATALIGLFTVTPSIAQLSDGTPTPAVDSAPLCFDRGSAALVQSLRKLQTRASMLMIVAHPDDEDGGTLTYEARGLGVRVGLMSLTRGEGGQNVMSADFWDALGLVRTEELLQSDRYSGINQYFARVVDFGFSKTKEESFEKWGHDRVLYDVVRVIRMTRPLVLTAVFVGAPSDGHGQHQVSGVIAQEAFKAAGDPNVFPDQIKDGLLPWKPLKIYARIPFATITAQGMYDYATGKTVPVRFYDYVNEKWIEGPLTRDIEIPTGTYDAVLGESYAQIGHDGLGFQKTQNGGTGPSMAGAATSGYHRFGSVVATSAKEKSFFDGIDTSIAGIASFTDGNVAFLTNGLMQMSTAAKNSAAAVDVQHPEKIAPVLRQGLAATRTLINEVEKSNISAVAKQNVLFELRVKEQQFNDALVQALGITMLATVAPERDPVGRFSMFAGLSETPQIVTPGQEFWVKVQATNPTSEKIGITGAKLNTPQDEKWDVQSASDIPTVLADNNRSALRFKVTVPKDAKFTRAYFSRPDIEQPYYDIDDASALNLPVAPYPLSAELVMNYDGEQLRISQVVQTVHKVQGPGQVLEPLLVGPSISVAITPKSGVVPIAGSRFDLTVTLHSNVLYPATGTLALALPQGWTSTPRQAEFTLANVGQEQQITFGVFPAKIEQREYAVSAVATYKGETLTKGYHLAGYEGIRPYPVYRAAEFKTRGIDVQVAPNVRVGYVMGTGDEVPQSLEQIGVKAQMLSRADIASGDLSRFDCIILGVRAYAARPELATHNDRLLRYVANGGIIFVQYNTEQYDRNFGPYPYTLTNDPEKVVDENASVTLLDADNPLLRWPNRITSKDFDGWVEERGHSFMQSWDPHYEALTETHDPDQDPQRGGLLYARYGKGVYIYGAYALYRQLPEGIPGAFRIFANVVSLAKNPERGKQEAK